MSTPTPPPTPPPAPSPSPIVAAPHDPYFARLVSCGCGCGAAGWLVCAATHTAVVSYAVNSVAATAAIGLLNEGRITETELLALWDADDAHDNDGAAALTPAPGAWH